jgi:uncharacterized protein YbjT (DUF2867 family)
MRYNQTSELSGGLNMANILVAGGTGALGSAIVAQLRASDHRIRILSRKTAPTDSSIEWARGNIITGDGLAKALADMNVVVNCAGDAQNAYVTDVLGVKRLLEMAKQARVRHFFHISIVGVERIDVEFYRHKVSAETAVADSEIPYSILRVTQFHNLLDTAFAKIEAVPEGYALPIAHDALFQVIDTRDVAEYLLPLLDHPAGRLPDLGGPEILRVEDMARVYLAARGIENPTFVDSPKKFFSAVSDEAFRQGINTVPGNRYGKITWADYARETHQEN